MKKILWCFILSFAGASMATAQDTVPHQKMEREHGMTAHQDHKMMEMEHMKMGSDCVMLTNGELHVMKSGKKTAVKDPVALSNGAIIMPDGTVKMKDGSTKQLKEGECMSMDGKLMRMKKSTTTQKTTTQKTITPM